MLQVGKIFITFFCIIQLFVGHDMNVILAHLMIHLNLRIMEP